VLDEAGEDVVDGDGVREGALVGDGEYVVAAVTQRSGGDAYFGGEDRGSGGAQDVVHRGGADPDEGLEAVDDVPAVQLEEPAPRGPR
jgi:hypothetical protein